MSYNIDSVEYIGDGRLSIDPIQVSVLVCHFGEGAYTPEINFIDGLEIDATDAQVIESISWCGEGSGTSFPNFLQSLALTTGTAEILICWEGGDSYSGLRVVDGKVTKHEIKTSLGPEIE